MADVPDFLSMSDEDFLKQTPASGEAPVSNEEASSEVVEVGDTQVVETTVVVEPVVEEIVSEKAPVKAAVKESKKAPVTKVVEAEVKPDANVPKTSEASESAEDKPTGTEAIDSAEVVEAVVPDYETFYNQIMTPFKANGRTVELKTPEEAIQLMQMGANYTKKMQELVPHRKVLTMLQNNGLMDEGKLSFLIDIEKKNPEAIKKLLKDSGVDPLEIDTSVEPQYREGNHKVSDEEVAFHATLDDMKSSPERLGTLQVINGDWDQASKEALWSNPDIMNVIHSQRENGIYDRINTEVNRRKVLGQIPGNVPFLQAYKIIGDEMTAANAFADLNIKAPVSQQQTKPTTTQTSQPGQVVATRVAAPKAALKNGARAAAASSNRQSPGKVQEPSKNPLAMSDEEFMKLDQFSGRL